MCMSSPPSLRMNVPQTRQWGSRWWWNFGVKCVGPTCCMFYVAWAAGRIFKFSDVLLYRPQKDESSSKEELLYRRASGAFITTLEVQPGTETSNGVVNVKQHKGGIYINQDLLQPPATEGRGGDLGGPDKVRQHVRDKTYSPDHPR
ncbi:unnamed protein product, partial [Choristocarpus tenellus]